MGKGFFRKHILSLGILIIFTVGCAESDKASESSRVIYEEVSMPEAGSFASTEVPEGAVKVEVTFEKSNGKTETEEYYFVEDMHFLLFSEEPWTMDLKGQEITLESVMKIASAGTIVNGSINTSKEAYIFNEGELRLGSPENDGGRFELFVSDGVGIENNGTLTLGYADLSVKSRTGILNRKTLLADRDNNDNHVTYSTEGGVILDNGGEALLYAADISGKAETFVVNNDKLTLFGVSFDGMGGIFVLNATDRELNLWDCSFSLDHDAEIAVKNHGTVNKGQSIYEGLSAGKNISASFKVFGGTSIENSGEWHAQGKINLKRGVGIHNKSIKDLTRDYEWIMIDEEGGTGLLNEGIFGFVKINATGGSPIVNSGSLTGEVRINAVRENYFGSLIHNEDTGIVSCNVYINAGSLNGAKLIENYGTFNGKGLYRNNNLMIYGGLKLLELKDWFSDTGLSTAEYKMVFDEPCRESAFIYNAGKLRDYNLEAYILGAGENYGVLWTEQDTESMFTGETLTVAAGSGITAFDVKEGSMLNFEYATITSDKDFLFALEDIVYDKADTDDSLIFNNILVHNKGIIGLTRDQSRLHFRVRGRDSVGFLNEGHIEGYELLLEVGGDSNIGLSNKTPEESEMKLSVNVDTLSAKVFEIGGNKGAVNEGVIHCSFLNGSVETEKDTQDREGRMDVGFINNEGSIVECEETVAAFCNNSNCIGLENHNIIKCGNNLEVRGSHGTVLSCENKSFTATKKLTVDLSDEKGDVTGMIIYSLVDVTDFLSVMVKGEYNFGVFIMTAGNLSQAFPGEFQGSYLYSEKNGHAVVNGGHLYLERPYFTKEPDGTWGEVLSNQGKFNYSWLYDKSYYDEEGVEQIGPWRGIGYGIVTQ